ncbi:MAG: DM13 domain-containing protein, partial [Tepidiformaceae bacterium]
HSWRWAMAWRLAKVPWFLKTFVVVGAMVAFGVVGNILIGVYFERTMLEEADPLLGLALVTSDERGSAGGQQVVPAAAVVVETRPTTTVEATESPTLSGSAVVVETPRGAAVVPTATVQRATVAPATSPPTAATSTPQPPETAGPTTASGPALLLRGTFRDGAPGHHGSGTAKIGRDGAGKLVLVVESFSVTNGPDLHVLLGPESAGGGSGIDLGKLKATDGTFSYAIPEGTDLAQFKSVTIWCKSFPTIFTYAPLEG